MVELCKKPALGKELAKIRIDFEESQTEMAQRLNVSLFNLRRIENGAQHPSRGFAKLILDHYQVDLIEKLGEEAFFHPIQRRRTKLDLRKLTTEQYEAVVQAVGGEEEMKRLLTVKVAPRPAQADAIAEMQTEPVVPAVRKRRENPAPEQAPPVVEEAYTAPMPKGVGFIDEDDDIELSQLGDLEDEGVDFE